MISKDDHQNEPLVSIGLPVRNGAPYLVSALESLLSQDYSNLEVLVSDNASTDETPRVCSDLSARDGRIKYHRNSGDLGAGANFLRALGLARGEYFMWAAHDDLWEPHFVSALVTCLRRNPSLIFAMTKYDRFSHVTDERNTPPAEGYPGLLESNSVFQNCCAYLRKGSSELIYGMFRRDVLLRTRFVKSQMYDWADVALINEVCTLGSVHLLPDVLFHTGFVAPRPLKSLSERKLPGFKLAYGTYLWESALVFSHARQLTLAERFFLLVLLGRQVGTMILTNEFPSLGRLLMKARRSVS